jgi:DNA-binding HxlR family transcriptional regulator
LSDYLQDPSLEQIKNFSKVNKIIDIDHDVFNPYRMVVLYGLFTKRFQSFQSLKELTKIKSDGNLASHLRALENQKLIKYYQQFAGRRPLAFYDLTEEGKEVFNQLRHGLRQFLDAI